MRWKATAPGRFYRQLFKPITLLGVTITPAGAVPDVSLSLKVDAADPSVAVRKAIEQIDAASGAARIAVNSPIDRDPTEIPVVHSVDTVDGEHVGAISKTATAVVKKTPID